ncbi:MAG: vWA domain-containing protein, partial [Thermoguttaceae bacterium]
MELLNPIAGWLALLAIPVILFYILKVRLRREPVSTMLFWHQVFEERRSRSFWRRLRHIISLLLSLLFLAILISAVLNPVFHRIDAIKTVIIFDHSASMNAIGPSGKTRLEEAKKELLGLLSVSGVQQQTAIIAVGAEPKVIVGFTNHLGTLRKAVNSITGTDSATDLESAIKLAQLLIRGEPNSRIFVFTDG